MEIRRIELRKRRLAEVATLDSSTLSDENGEGLVSSLDGGYVLRTMSSLTIWAKTWAIIAGASGSLARGITVARMQ